MLGMNNLFVKMIIIWEFWGIVFVIIVVFGIFDKEIILNLKWLWFVYLLNLNCL